MTIPGHNTTSNPPVFQCMGGNTHLFDDLFRQICQKFVHLGLVDSEGRPDKKLFKLSLPALNDTEKQAVYKLLKEKITHEDPDHGVSFTTTPQKIEKKLDEEIGLSSLVLCGSRLIQALGVDYFIRALEAAYEHLHGTTIDMEKELGSEILDFLGHVLSVASDTDFRNYFKTPFFDSGRAQETILAHLFNVNRFKDDKEKLAAILKCSVSRLDKCPFDIIRRGNVFDKLVAGPNFGVVSLKDVEFINVKGKLTREYGILTTGSLRLELLPLFRGEFNTEMRPLPGSIDGWRSLFDISRGLIEPVDDNAIESLDIFKAWRSQAKGKNSASPQSMSRMVESFLKDNPTVEEIAEELIKDAKNHLKNSINGGGAVLFHALRSFWKGDYKSDSELTKIVRQSKVVWGKSQLAPFFELMCRNPPLPFSSIYSAIGLKMLNEEGNISKTVKLRLGGEWDAIINLNIDEALASLDLSNLALIAPEKSDRDLAEKLCRRDAAAHAGAIKKLLCRAINETPSMIKALQLIKPFPNKQFLVVPLIKLINEKPSNFSNFLVKSIEDFFTEVTESDRLALSEALLNNMTNCHLFADTLSVLLQKLIAGKECAKAYELLAAADAKQAWTARRHEKTFLFAVCRIARDFAENGQVDKAFDLFASFVSASRATPAFKFKRFFLLLAPLIRNRPKIPCKERIHEILTDLLSDIPSHKGYVAERCRSLTSHFLEEDAEAAHKLWLLGRSFEVWKGFEINDNYMLLVASLITKTHPENDTLLTLLEEFEHAYSLPEKSEELEKAIAAVSQKKRSLFEENLLKNRIDEALAVLSESKNFSAADFNAISAALEARVLAEKNDSLLFDSDVASLYEKFGKSRAGPALELAEKTGKFNQTLATILSETSELDEEQEMKLLALIREDQLDLPPPQALLPIAELLAKHKKFASGFSYFSKLAAEGKLKNCPKKITKFCYLCMDKAEPTDIDKCNDLFEAIYQRSHNISSVIPPQLLIKLSHANLPTDKNQSLRLLSIFLKIKHNLFTRSFDLIVAITAKLLETRDERFVQFTKQIMPKLKSHPALLSQWSNQLATIYKHNKQENPTFDLSLMEVLLKQKNESLNKLFHRLLADFPGPRLCKGDLLRFIQLVRDSRMKDDAIWDYMAKQACFQKDSEVKKACWDCFIDVIKPNPDSHIFKTGNPFTYLCFCAETAKAVEVTTMLSHFKDMRDRIDNKSPVAPFLVIRSYLTLLLRSHELLSSKESPPHEMSFAAKVWESYSAIEDLVKANETLEVSAKIRVQQFFILCYLEDQEKFISGLELLSTIDPSKADEPEAWKKMISCAFEFVTVSTYLRKDLESPERIERVIAKLLQKISTEHLPFETLILLSDFYCRIASIIDLPITSQEQRIALFDSMLQKSNVFPPIVSDITARLVEDIIENGNEHNLQKLFYIVRFEDIHTLFGKNTEIFQRFLHTMIKLGNQLHLYRAQRLIQYAEVKKWLGEKAEKELSCHLQYALAHYNPMRMDPAFAVRIYNECLEMNCSFQHFPEAHDTFLTILDLDFITYKRPNHLVSFFKSATNPEKHCYKYFEQHALQLLENIFNNISLDSFLLIDNKHEIVNYLVQFFNNHLNQILPKVVPVEKVPDQEKVDAASSVDLPEELSSSKMETDAESTTFRTECIGLNLIETILAFNIYNDKAYHICESIFDKLMKISGSKSPSVAMFGIDFLIHFQSKVYQISKPQFESNLVADRILSLINKSTSRSLMHAFLLLGRYKTMIKKHIPDRYRELCKLSFESFTLCSLMLPDKIRKVFMHDALSVLDCMLEASKSTDKLPILANLLELCNELTETQAENTPCPLIHAFYGRLILISYNLQSSVAKKLFLRHVNIFFNTPIPPQKPTSLYFDGETVLHLSPCISEAYKEQPEILPLMEKCLQMHYGVIQKPKFMEDIAEMYKEKAPDSLAIHILATSKVQKNDLNNFYTLRSLILDLIKSQTPEAFAHALLLLTRNGACLKSPSVPLYRRAMREIKNAISTRFWELSDPMTFINYINELIALKKIDPVSFAKDLLNVFSSLTNEDGWMMPPYLYLVYFEFLKSFSILTNGEKIPDILKFWDRLMTFLTTPGRVNFRIANKNDTEKFSLILSTPFELLKSLSKNETSEDIQSLIRKSYIFGIRRLINSPANQQEFGYCAQFLLNTVPERIISDNSDVWRKLKKQTVQKLSPIT